MIEAQIHRKIPSVAQSEDSLTSTVFGILKYSVMRPTLARFLGNSVNHADESPLSLAMGNSWLTAGDPADIRFWDRDTTYGEPDLLMVGADWAIVVEVKLWAGVSGEDQLRRYHDLLTAKFPQKRHRHVIFLTQDLERPPLPREVTGGIEKNLWWLSWFELSRVLDIERPHSPLAAELALDLARFMSHKGLSFFRGFSNQEAHSDEPIFWNDVAPLISPTDAWPIGTQFWLEDLR